MKVCRQNPVNVIAAGIVILLLFSVVLFWGRFVCNAVLVALMSPRMSTVELYPSGLVPGEPTEPPYRAPDSNTQYSRAKAEVRKDAMIPASLGLFNTILTTSPLLPRSYIWYGSENEWESFDRQSGLIVRRTIRRWKQADGASIERPEDSFAGPNGVGGSITEELGRFEDAVISKEPGQSGIIVYDRVKRQFFAINFWEGTVIAGAKLDKNDSREPIAIHSIRKDDNLTGHVMWCSWQPPQRQVEEKRWEQIEPPLADDAEPNAGGYYSYGYSTRWALALDKRGRIWLLDATKCEYVLQAGFLPKPQSLFCSQSVEPGRPDEVQAYEAHGVYILLTESEDGKGRFVDEKYLGMCAASLSREGTALAMVVFDANGTCVGRKYSTAVMTSEGPVSSSTGVYFERAWGPCWTAIEFLLENMQGPALNLAAFLCGDCIETAAGHRALLILPNSFVGMLGRGDAWSIWNRLFILAALMAPGLLLSVWLAVCAHCDAKMIGLSTRQRKYWIIVTIAFGLAAYITYCLVRPRDVLVTCTNCGKMRRPDMDVCHRCGSKWQVPELVAPTWRIAD